MAVAHDLNLDVARPDQVLLEVHGRIAERRTRLVLRHLQLRRERARLLGYAHAFPAATGGRLDQHWKPDVAGDLERGVRIVDRAFTPGHGRDADARHRFPRHRLVAHQPDLLRGRT